MELNDPKPVIFLKVTLHTKQNSWAASLEIFRVWMVVCVYL
uniref:Uncharacterized protein n=1 Tax=Solanum lycopersicum TaxID=4081 RepID=A0A3Q7IV61_SOLLC